MEKDSKAALAGLVSVLMVPRHRVCPEAPCPLPDPFQHLPHLPAQRPATQQPLCGAVQPGPRAGVSAEDPEGWKAPARAQTGSSLLVGRPRTPSLVLCPGLLRGPLPALLGHKGPAAAPTGSPATPQNSAEGPPSPCGPRPRDPDSLEPTIPRRQRGHCTKPARCSPRPVWCPQMRTWDSDWTHHLAKAKQKECWVTEHCGDHTASSGMFLEQDTCQAT